MLCRQEKNETTYNLQKSQGKRLNIVSFQRKFCYGQVEQIGLRTRSLCYELKEIVHVFRWAIVINTLVERADETVRHSLAGNFAFINHTHLVS